ncbi:hypothetical protein DPMN_039979 [Dreissena polymorpha]|uniref:C2H2-type domain-containing protein n=1 Tax=Dreissena polymorpha TaxID=45954 RepID=A0A9D4CW94_DREPO|nr:hypothetical protein DPMN_039979 [Dreissena polymorpha]
MRTHSGERLYKNEKCDTCDYIQEKDPTSVRCFQAFKQNRTNSEVCSYACKRTGDLKKHMSLSTGARLYNCECVVIHRPYICGAHMRIHTGEKSFQCDMCTYRRKTIHMRIHTEERYHVVRHFRSTCSGGNNIKSTGIVARQSLGSAVMFRQEKHSKHSPPCANQRELSADIRETKSIMQAAEASCGRQRLLLWARAPQSFRDGQTWLMDNVEAGIFI